MCNNCNSNICICSPVPEMNCDPCLTQNTCVDKLDAACVFYNLNRPDDISNLSCFLGLDSNVSLKTILETLDEKLCTLESISDIEFVDNDCISWEKSVSEAGVITITPIIDYACLIATLKEDVDFCEAVLDCNATPPSCQPVTSIQKLFGTTNSLTFSYGTVTGATSYEVKLFSDFTYTTQVGATQTILHPTNTVTFSGLSASTSYFVQIKVNCSNGLSSTITSAGPFVTEAVPTISCPTVTIDDVTVTNNSVTVEWTGGVGATQYNVYINSVLQAGMPTSSTTFTKNLLANGNYVVKVEALPCAGTPQSDSESFVINYTAPALTLNCSSLSIISGSLIEGVSSSATIRIPVTSTGSDIVNVTLSGTGITGSVTGFVLSPFTTFIDIPVTYNGSSPSGARSITVSVTGSVIPTTNCTGNVTITCPTCANPTVSISDVTTTGFSVNVSPLAVGEDYDIVVKQGLTTITSAVGVTTSPYVFNAGSPETTYTVEVVKNCVCNTSGTVSTNVTTDSGDVVENFFVSIDNLPGAIITDVTPAFYTQVLGSYPLNDGESYSGLHAGWFNNISVDLFIPPGGGMLSLYKNGLEEESLILPSGSQTAVLNNAGLIVFNVGDLMEIILQVSP